MKKKYFDFGYPEGKILTRAEFVKEYGADAWSEEAYQKYLKSFKKKIRSFIRKAS